MTNEELYKRMVKNLMKKNNFLNLSWLLDKGDMTEDDFQVELETNPELYHIDYSSEVTPELINQINDILGDLSIQLTVSEVSELFSIELESLNTFLEQTNVEQDGE